MTEPIRPRTVAWIGAACTIGIVGILIAAHVDLNPAPLIGALVAIFLFPRLIASMWTRGRSEDWRRERRR